MIVAGANAGVYDLKTMAFESMECFLRAGESIICTAGRIDCHRAITAMGFSGPFGMLNYQKR